MALGTIATIPNLDTTSRLITSPMLDDDGTSEGSLEPLLLSDSEQGESKKDPKSDDECDKLVEEELLKDPEADETVGPLLCVDNKIEQDVQSKVEDLPLNVSNGESIAGKNAAAAEKEGKEPQDPGDGEVANGAETADTDVNAKPIDNVSLVNGEPKKPQEETGEKTKSKTVVKKRKRRSKRKQSLTEREADDTDTLLCLKQVLDAKSKSVLEEKNISLESNQTVQEPIAMGKQQGQEKASTDDGVLGGPKRDNSKETESVDPKTSSSCTVNGNHEGDEARPKSKRIGPKETRKSTIQTRSTRRTNGDDLLQVMDVEGKENCEIGEREKREDANGSEAAGEPIAEIKENGLRIENVQEAIDDLNTPNQQDTVSKRKSSGILGEALKKRKVDDTDATDVDEKQPENDTDAEPPFELSQLKSIYNYMFSKKLQALTRTDLEELCLQKVVEVLCANSEQTELRHKIRALEMKEVELRKELKQMRKQCRELMIVHKKFLEEMARRGDKPLKPLKITRSVGLQVCFTEKKFVKPIPNGPLVSPVNIQPKPIAPQQSLRPVQNVKTVAVNGNNNPNGKTNGGNKKSSTTPEKKTDIVDLTGDDDRAPVKTVKIGPVTAGTRIMLMPYVTTASVQQTPPVLLKLNAVPASGIIASQNQTLSVVNRAAARVGVTSSSPSTPIIAPTVVTTAATNGPLRSIQSNVVAIKPRHPAPLPLPPNQATNAARPTPPKPLLNLSKSGCGTGIVLQWKMPHEMTMYEKIASYQLYAYQEKQNVTPRTDNWSKIGDVKALALPMAVTLTQFTAGNRYFFAVRAVDVLERVGFFSDPCSILL